MLKYAQIKLSRLIGLDGNSKKHSTAKTTASVLSHSFRDPIQVDLIFLPEEHQRKDVDEILADDNIKLTLVEGHDRTLNVCNSLFKSDRDNPPGNIEVVKNKAGRVIDWLIPATVAKSESKARAVAYSIDHNATTAAALGDEALLELFDNKYLFGQLDDLLAEGEPLASFDLDMDSIANMLLDQRDQDMGLDNGDDNSDDGFDEVGDEETEPDVEPMCKSGDLWQIGNHKLFIGDCREPESWHKLMAGQRVNVLFTSPPYASQRKYDESSGFEPIKPDDFSRWYSSCQKLVKQYLSDDGSYFLNIKEHCQDGQRHLYVKKLVVDHCDLWGWQFVDEFCWLRNPPPGSWPNRFKNGFEPIFHFATGKDAIKFNPNNVAKPSNQCFNSDDGPRTDVANGQHWNMPKTDSNNQVSGMALPSNVIDACGVARNMGHQAAFPAKLPQFFINAFSDPGDIILDPFSGSGTTMYAAATLDRIGYGIELSPAYGDVIIARLSQITGEDPIKLN